MDEEIKFIRASILLLWNREVERSNHATAERIRKLKLKIVRFRAYLNKDKNVNTYEKIHRIR